MGERRKKAKESRVVPHPKLNPGCATDCGWQGWIMIFHRVLLKILWGEINNLCLMKEIKQMGRSHILSYDHRTVISLRQRCINSAAVTIGNHMQAIEWCHL